MRSIILLAAEVALAVGATAACLVTLTARGNQSAEAFDKQIPVAVEQLTQAGGPLPVEVRCGVARLTTPSTLESLPCMAINNTGKNIVSLAASYTVVTEKSGEGESLNTNLISVDSLVHPDIRRARGLKPIRPGASHPLQPPGPITYEGETIVRIEFSLDYVEFEDNSSLGPDKHGSRAIKAVREGAAQYKSWLVKKYHLNKRDATALTKALEESALPAELQLGGDGDLNEGAQMYRRFMRGVFQERGAAEFKKYIDN
jgi:hypothetical protein